jgi:2-succinyl-6-hydroxy-2,4-cyclohexadiene-1-carboxylate synthase
MSAAVVLLHGFTHTGASWEPVIAELPQRYRAIAPDLRGHGGACEAQPVSLECVLDDLAALAPEHFTLVGYSMGGRIALHAALALPARVRRLVLIGASPGLADADERAARRSSDEALARELESLSIEEFARRWARTPVLADAPPEVAARAHADRLRSTPPGLARALRGLGTGALPPLWEALPALNVPVDLVAGERDAKFRQLAHEMAAHISRARVAIVPGAGHAVHLEAPAAVARIIAQDHGSV